MLMGSHENIQIPDWFEKTFYSRPLLAIKLALLYKQLQWRAHLVNNVFSDQFGLSEQTVVNQ